LYIKATEGKDYTDNYFKRNWDNAGLSGIKRGAYHFFTFGSTGMDQAKHFIHTVSYEEDSLPPVIDVEFGGNSSKVPEKSQFIRELRDFIKLITARYKKSPVLYVTYEAYEKYIVGEVPDYRIWIRDILKYPELKSGREWSIWQYNDRGHMAGIRGFVDLDVFEGNVEDFKNYISE
jgi:Lyzozyme M1 (1,4-beta-N-acetylmuramidase)